MTKQYRITTQNIHPQDEGDCFLDPLDPVNGLKATSIMGGLGTINRLAEYNLKTQEDQIKKILDQRQQAETLGIRPGSPAWLAMFSK